jgi:zinc protease
LQQRVLSRANDQVLRTLINNNIYYDRTMQFQEQLEASIGALTAAQINAALRTYIDLDKMLIVKAGDFAKPST